MWCQMLTSTLSQVPEVPQEVTLSENAVTSVSVTWRPPPGQVMQYKVRHAQQCASPEVEAVRDAMVYWYTDSYPQNID